MRHVLVLINNSGVGGTERRLGRLFARLAMEGKETVFVLNRQLWARLVAGKSMPAETSNIICLAEPFEWLAARIPWFGDGTRFWIRKLDYLLMACRILLRYGLSHPVLFHVVLGGAYVILPLMYVRRDHRYVISVTDPNLKGHVGSVQALPLFRAAIAYSHAVDALTEEIATSLVETGTAPEKISSSRGSMVDHTRFRPAGSKELWVVFAGRLVEEKNPLLFLEAVCAISRAVPEARFFMLGDGPLKGLVQKMLNREALHDVVTTGFVQDIAPILSRARVFVSLQRTDNYPSQGLLEAMASGTATVATDVGATWRLVDEDTGIRVGSSATEVARAVIDLLRQPDRCARLGAHARRRVIQFHSEEEYGRHLRDLHTRVGSSSAQPRSRAKQKTSVQTSITKP